jgi:mono/diheme cytochrome c family protein
VLSGGALVALLVAACGSSSPKDAKGIYSSQGCGGCHTSAALGGSGTSGPNLDGVAASASAKGLSATEFVRRALTDPTGLGLTGMPSFGATLSDAQISALAGALGGAGQSGSTGSTG